MCLAIHLPKNFLIQMKQCFTFWSARLIWSSCADRKLLFNETLYDAGLLMKLLSLQCGFYVLIFFQTKSHWLQRIVSKWDSHCLRKWRFALSKCISFRVIYAEQNSSFFRRPMSFHLTMFVGTTHRIGRKLLTFSSRSSHPKFGRLIWSLSSFQK